MYLLAVLMAATMPFTAMAQDDDLYFNPKEVFFGNSSVLNHVSGVFDVVMANINRNILLEDMKLFRSVMNIGGSLILSGFYEEDIPVLLENAAELGLHETNRHVDNNWACLVLGE
mgnify:CR=1 FL=1